MFKYFTSAKENEYIYILYGWLSFIGFVSFYFLNHIVIKTNIYENFAIRSICIILSLILALKNYWPNCLKKFLSIYWYIVLLFNLPMFFTYMLLQNKFSTPWLLNELMSLTLLILLVDLLSFFIITIIGISGAIVLQYLVIGSIILPNNIAHIIVNYIILLGFFYIPFAYKQNHFYQEIQDKAENLEKALAIKTEFLNNISHEVRTPIQGVTAISKGLVDFWHDIPEEQRFSYAKEVAKNANRLFSLVNNILDLSRMTGRKMNFVFENTNLVELINDIIDEAECLYIKTSGKDIKINFINNSSNSLIIADSSRITQVLRNLFSNSIKYSDHGTIRVELGDSEIAGLPAIVFSIQDEGVGIPEEELDNIFEAFTQSSRTKSKAGGTGLGLSICKNIIEGHGGRIWAENAVGGGACFYFIIPINPSKKLENFSI